MKSRVDVNLSESPFKSLIKNAEENRLLSIAGLVKLTLLEV